MAFSSFNRFIHAGLLVAALAGFGLAGCAEFEKSQENIDSDRDIVNQGLQAISPKSPLAQPLMIDKRPYYGSQAVPITNGTPLPPQYEENGAIVMTFARAVTMPELMRMIQAVTGLRAVAPASSTVKADGGGGSSSEETTFLPSDGEQVAGGRVVWQGRLSDLLDQAADVFDADWSFDGTSVTFAQQITRTFMLHALASELSVKGSVKSGSSGSTSSNLPEVDVTSTSSMKVWDEIKEAVNTITDENGKASFSPSTGTITVTGTPDVVRRVESYLNQQNSMRLRRVAVAVKIISVATSDAISFSGSLKGVIEKVFDTASLRTVGNSGEGLAIGILKAPDFVKNSDAATESLPADTQSIQEDRLLSEIKALKNVKKASVSHSGALVTLSDQPAPLQVGSQVSYLARTSSTSGDTGGSVSLEPGTINTGLMMTVLPRIVEGNKILMRLSVAISDVVTIKEFGTDSVKIQLPEVDTTGFLQNAVVTSGETLIMAGFEKNSNSNSEDGTPGIPWLGGGVKKSSLARVVNIMMITAEILPEDPISVIGQ